MYNVTDMRLTSCLTIICLMQVLLNVNATKGKYTVIAPGTIHCNEKYTVAVAVHYTTRPCQIKVGITGLSYNVTQHIQVTQNEVRTVEFLLPCFENGDYKLTVEGINCLDNFKNTTKLIYNKFNNHVRLQTDKDFYQPGDDINFRVLFLDKDLRPTLPKENALIWIADGKRNRVNAIKDLKTIKGVYTGKFKISKFPVTGDWSMGVRNDGGFVHAVHFVVDKYILPKFLVKVEATKSVSVKDGDMQVIVRANYDYGKTLQGKVTVVLVLEYSSYHNNTEPPMLTITAKMNKGIANIDLNIKEYAVYLPYENSPSYMTVVATVEEKFTGVKMNGTASTAIYPYRYSINCVNYDAFATFDVNNEREVLFQIRNINGSYLNDTKSTIKFICKAFRRKINGWPGARTLDNNSFVQQLSKNRIVSFKGHMNETGFVSFRVALPGLPHVEGYSHYYSLELKYLDEQRQVCGNYLSWDLIQVNSPKSEKEKSKKYFVLEDKHWPDKKLYVNKASPFTLKSSKPLSYIGYNVIGRDNILKSGRIELPGKPKVYNLTLTPEFSWAPNFYVYVHYIDVNGELHFAERQYEVVFELENKINITVAKAVMSGEEVVLKIQSSPNSFVGLMAVDQITFRSRRDNALNFYELNRVLGSYGTHTLPKTGYSKYPGETSGCVTLTNADYFYDSIRYKNRRGQLLVAAHTVVAFKAGYGTYVKAPKHTPQALLFADIENTEAAEFNWTIRIPKTVRSWALTAFSVNPLKGLGVTREETKITTFLPFLIFARLPYSVKIDEVINVPAWVSNYLDKALDIDVILDNSDYEYDFIEFDNSVVNEQKLCKRIRVPAKGAAGVSFLLKPKIVGSIALNFTAVSPVACDTIYKSMKVVPAGMTQYANRAYFINLKNYSEFRSTFVLEFPQDIIPDTEHVEVGVMSDILGPVLNNLDNLVRLPMRCGEQTMSTLLTCYLVLKYLKDLKRLTPTMDIKLRYNLETGYQSILYYRHWDGSFSSFGPAQIKGKIRKGSTWLTAYVVRSLQQIREFVNVDGKIIEEGLDYLSKQQAANGSFTEHGDNFYASQRNHISVTCSAVLALMENNSYAEKFSKELGNGLDFIAHYIGKSDSIHAQSLGTFTLNKAKYATAKYELYKLKDLAKTELDHKWWSEEKQRRVLFSSDVEVTSYALLTLLDQYSTKIDDVLPIINWLIAQRNSNGGFVSMQDTVIGLTALIEFAKFADYEPAKMTVNISSNEIKETITLTEDILYENIKMPAEDGSINFTAIGTGSALLEIGYQYNVMEKVPNPSFMIKIAKIYNINTPLRFQMIVCVYYMGERDSSNMALLEISTPSGYVIDEESLNVVQESERVSYTELKYSNTLLIVYFDHLHKTNGTCFLLEVIRTHAVALQKPASIVLYDYYDNSKKAIAFYEIVSELCDICETEEECSKCM